MSSANLVHLGDLRLTIALAGAVLAWLMAAHAYRLGCWWGIAFGGVIGAVSISKVLYMGWGIENSAVAFKAISGHAAGSAAVFPILLYLLATGWGHTTQNWAAMGGGLLSAGIAVALVQNNEHAASEAMGGWCIGVMASGTTWKKLRQTAIRPSSCEFGAALAFTTAVAIATCMHFVPVGWLLIKVARALSGAQRLHAWIPD